jgi:hypothetical protein
MSLLQIPVSESPDQSFTVVLDQIAYDIRLQWNNREESWYLYCGVSNRPFLFKVKLTTITDVFKKYRSYESCPKGSLRVIDLNKSYGRLTRDGFSSGRFALQYITADSWTELERLNVKI